MLCYCPLIANPLIVTSRSADTMEPAPLPLRTVAPRRSRHAGNLDLLGRACGQAQHRTTTWNTRPLCCKYLVVHFESLLVQVQSDAPVRDRTLQWAYGVVADGRSEVLGAWLNPCVGAESWKTVFDDLKTRGVEGIRFVFSKEQTGLHSALVTAYPSAKVLPCAESSVRQARGPLGGADGEVALDGRDMPAVDSDASPRLKRVLQRCEVAVRQLHHSLRRAVVRQPCFADQEAAASLVVGLLERAESRLGVGDAFRTLPFVASRAQARGPSGGPACLQPHRLLEGGLRP